MRKKKLLSRNSELEAQKNRAIHNEEYRRGMVEGMIKGLLKCGVRTEMIFQESPMIESVSLDGEVRQIPVKVDNGGIFGLRFDFTEHDEKVMNK